MIECEAQLPPHKRAKFGHEGPSGSKVTASDVKLRILLAGTVCRSVQYHSSISPVNLGFVRITHRLEWHGIENNQREIPFGVFPGRLQMLLRASLRGTRESTRTDGEADLECRVLEVSRSNVIQINLRSTSETNARNPG